MQPTTENIITRNPETDEVIGIYEVTIQHLRNPIASHSENWQDTADAWSVVINNQSFDYFTGIGLRVTNPLSEIVRGNYMRKDWSHQSLSIILKATKPVTPKLDDVLTCLVRDAVGSAQTFDDWCSDYGYDTDSRKALDIYMACQETAKKLRLARVPIQKEAERLQGY
jgi:hypothetical protein